MRETDSHAQLEAAGWKARTLEGFMGTAGPLWTRREEPGWAYGLLPGPGHLNPLGVVHGGVLLTLMDHVMSTVAWESSGRIPCVTLHLGGDFVAPAREGSLIEVRAVVGARTPGMLFMEATAVAGGETVAKAKGIMRVVRKPSAAPPA